MSVAGVSRKMRKLALFNLSVLFLFALAEAVDASVQSEPVEPRSLCAALDSPMDREMAPAEAADFASCTAICSLEMPRLVIDACVACVGLGPRGKITLGDLAEAAKLRRQTLPEPSTIAVWSLIGLCWGGVRCWRRRQGPVQNRVGWGRPGTRRSLARPPWPDHVRARILEIIEKGAPR
jgi:hypothetical protein